MWGTSTKSCPVRCTPSPLPVASSSSYCTLNDGVLCYDYVLYTLTRVGKKRNRFFTVTAIVLPSFHRAGYCNSTALIETKRAKTLSYMSFLPSTFLFPSRKGSIGGSITQYYYASRNVWFSPYSIIFERRQLASNKEREMCSYPRTT